MLNSHDTLFFPEAIIATFKRWYIFPDIERTSWSQNNNPIRLINQPRRSTQAINVDARENARQLRSDVPPALHKGRESDADERINKCIVEVGRYVGPSISSLQRVVPDIAISTFVTGNFSALRALNIATLRRFRRVYSLALSGFCAAVCCHVPYEIL